MAHGCPVGSPQCAALKPSQQAETLQLIKADYPTMVFSSDILTNAGQKFVTLYDKFSGYLLSRSFKGSNKPELLFTTIIRLAYNRNPNPLVGRGWRKHPTSHQG